MQTTATIKGIDVDILSNDVFIDLINEFLTTEKMQVIFFASKEVLKRASKGGEYKKLADMAELFLPGEEESLLEEYHADAMNAGDIVVSCKSFGLVLENLKKQDRSLYIVSENSKNVELLEKYCKQIQPELMIVGSSVYTENLDGAAVVNEINSHIPDILLVNLPVDGQAKWILEHIAHFNAKICIAIGGVANRIIFPQENIPNWVRSLHLTQLYRKLFLSKQQ